MRRTIFLMMVLVSSNSSSAQDFLPKYARSTPMDAYLPPAPFTIVGEPASESGIKEIETLRYYKAWWAEDPEGLIATFSIDAQWTNAFGLVILGHDEMRRCFPEMFRHFDATETEMSKRSHSALLGRMLR